MSRLTFRKVMEVLTEISRPGLQQDSIYILRPPYLLGSENSTMLINNSMFTEEISHKIRLNSIIYLSLSNLSIKLSLNSNKVWGCNKKCMRYIHALLEKSSTMVKNNEHLNKKNIEKHPDYHNEPFQTVQ